MQVTFSAGPMIDYPPDLELSRAKVEVFDPDLEKIACAWASGPLPVHETITFPDLQVKFDKSGGYITWPKVRLK